MTQTSPNRIPLQVRHANNGHSKDSFNEHYDTGATSSNYYRSSSRGRSPVSGLPQDEQDRMKQRMRDFEERCKKWRDEFFSKESTLRSVPFTNEYEVPPPPPPPPTTTSTTTTTYSPFGESHFSTNTAPSTQFSSTLHKGFIEETRDGRKVYKIELDIGDFHSNEIEISTRGKMLIVKGDHEIRAGSTTETKTFNREITLPDYVDTSSVNAYLIDNNAVQGLIKPANSVASANSKLIVEAGVLNDLYFSRRSGLNTIGRESPSPPHTRPVYRAFSPHAKYRAEKLQQQQQQQQASSSSHYSSTKNLATRVSNNDLTTTTTTTTASTLPKQTVYVTTTTAPVAQPVSPPIDTREKRTQYVVSTTTNANEETIPGYPLYSKDEGYMIYKFNLSAFNQSEIHLSITEHRTLEIRASREIQDSLGKTYREFKREIQLDNNVDASKIKNVLSHDGLLTLKIPVNATVSGIITHSANSQQQAQNSSNHHTTHSTTSYSNNSPRIANAYSLKNLSLNDTVDINNNTVNASSAAAIGGFREYYSNNGKLVKLCCDLNGYDPENLKIILSAQNELKIVAQKFEKSTSVQKQCTRQYSLPSYIQPESMKAVMSRDGVLTVDFNN